MGRLFYKVNEVDRFQVCVFVYGAAQSGKSLLLQLINMIIPPELIGIFSSNMEKQFGLSPLIGCHLWACPEVKDRFTMPLGDFQSMITGEETSVAVKFEAAQRWKCTSHGLLIGNQIPSEWLSGHTGAIVRRVAQIKFPNKVRSKYADTNLLNKIAGTYVNPQGVQSKSELGMIMRKWNACYLNFSHDMDLESGTVLGKTTNDFWSLAKKHSSMFERAEKALTLQVEGLYQMLSGEGDKKEFFPIEGAIAPLNADGGVISEYSKFRKESGLPPVQVTSEIYEPTFHELKCNVTDLRALGLNKKLPFEDPIVDAEGNITSAGLEIDLGNLPGNQHQSSYSPHWCDLYARKKDQFVSDRRLLVLPDGTSKDPIIAAQSYVLKIRELSWPPNGKWSGSHAMCVVGLLHCGGTQRMDLYDKFASVVYDKQTPEICCPVLQNLEGTSFQGNLVNPIRSSQSQREAEQNMINCM